MKKRILSLIMALILPVTLLCGCNSEIEKSASSPESSAGSPESSVSSPESSVSSTESSAGSTESSVSSPESSVSSTESSASSPESSVSSTESSVSSPESSVSSPESSVSSTESSASSPESSVSSPESSESSPESSASSTESSAGTPAETNPALQKYYEEMMENYFEYVSGAVPGTTPEVARGIAEAETAGLKLFEEMTVPPEYSDRHNALMKAAETEREYIKVLLDYANGVIDLEDFEKRSLEIRPDGRSEFTTKCLGIIADLNHEPSVVPTDKGQMLEMLSRF